MRVKRFTGDNVTETMAKVKQELGPEAIILQTRQYKEGGFFGLFAKQKVEVTAAVDYEPRETRTNQTTQVPQNDTFKIQEEIKNLHSIIEKMSRQIQEISVSTSNWPPPLQKWVISLEQAGFNEKLIDFLLKNVQKNLNGLEIEDNRLVFRHIEETVRKMCSRTAAIEPGIEKPKVVALIGPTGVGKTTTIGKLAAGFGIVDKRKVAMITTDTFRVAAVEQLKTFGQIISVPVEVAMTPSALTELLNRHTDKELIFIDTAGRSPHHKLHMHELKAFMEAAKPDFTMLVLSATTKFNDQSRIIKLFKPLATHLIITKLDETVSSGSILNLLDYTSLPIAYLTNGQNVPNDIEVATPDSLTRYILAEVQAID